MAFILKRGVQSCMRYVIFYFEIELFLFAFEIFFLDVMISLFLMF